MVMVVGVSDLIKYNPVSSIVLCNGFDTYIVLCFKYLRELVLCLLRTRFIVRNFFNDIL